LTTKSGAEARDYAEVAKKENLKPLELELRKIEDTVDKIKDDMLYMKSRGL
jgi:p24 family protein delta-1